jgi:hypothetical protein
MSPSPKTAVPSETTATVFRFMVRLKARSGSASMALHTLATPGVYAIERSSRVRIFILERTSILPPRCIRNVLSEMLRTRVSSSASTASTISRPWSELRAFTVMSRTVLSPPMRTMSTAPTIPPASPTVVRILPRDPGWCRNSIRNVML